MPNKAMNLTFGDFVMLEIALVHYMKDLDLSMQCGQFISELLGKLEYEMAQIRAAAAGGPGAGPLEPLGEDKPGT